MNPKLMGTTCFGIEFYSCFLVFKFQDIEFRMRFFSVLKADHLVLSANPNLTAEQVRHILSWTAEKVTYNYDSIAALGTWDLQAGYGRINAHLAVALAINTNNVAQNIEEHPIAIMANPSGCIELKNQSSEPQFVEIMSTWGQCYCLWVEPHAVYQQPTAPGVYFMRCGGQKSKIVVI